MFLKGKSYFLLYKINLLFRFPIEFFKWSKRRYSPPLPELLKRSFLTSFSNKEMCWVETGTYKGITSLALARKSKQVITIEPDSMLYRRANSRLSIQKNIRVINGTSQESLMSAVNYLSFQDQVSFYLDGHFSGGVTYKGDGDSPLLAELNIIQTLLDRKVKFLIIIDDVRLTYQERVESGNYPSVNHLVTWCAENNFSWRIENDMFIALN